MPQTRPVWAEINLNNIIHNYQEVRRLVGPHVKIMAVVKANAYGHGVLEVAKTLEKAGADRFAVGLLNEAVHLRESGVTKPLMILGWTPVDDYPRALTHHIILTIFSLQEAQELSRISLSMGQKACVHLKLDTGMGRIGFRPDADSLEQISKIVTLPGLEVEGIFTHLAKADEQDKSYTILQLRLFEGFVRQVREKTGFIFPLRHTANSAAVIDHPEAYFDMVRPGIMLYGLKPSSEVRLEKVDLRQAMALYAQVAFAKEVPENTAVSYGGIFVTSGNSRIATVPLGYADGYSRLLSGRAEVICRGQRAPVIGRVCMDQLMFDASCLRQQVEQGDLVTLIGRGGEQFISVDELAGRMGTVNYEITCMLSARVPRIYLK